MESLGSLKQAMISLSNFCKGDMFALIYKLPPDIGLQLSKQEKRYRYSAFHCKQFSGRFAFENFVKENPEARLQELRIGTYPGAIRIFNDKYIQKQLVTRTIFGLKIDLLPNPSLKRPTQMVIINDIKFSRIGMAPYTPEFLKEEMREKINEYNRLTRLKKPIGVSQFL
jgi:hypothetical protein